LVLDVKALLAGEMGQVLMRLQEGIGLPEHERFITPTGRE
ncbi:Uma2 family endonuclease, partial [Geitlerinema sp. P-1104]|nr:Uma2 family endonuclease [Geitlerinema sp. P-1104]